MKEHILSKKRLCIGCGACASSCKHGCITFSESAIGHYVPHVDETKCVKCGMCLSNCPINGNYAVPPVGEHHNEIVGEYRKSYIGYDPKLRHTSASGGLLTSFLYYILSLHVVDTVVCLKPQKNETGYYEYSFVTTPQELITHSRSAYYPMQINQVIDYIRNNDGKYAIVVLPCQAKAIRLLQHSDKRLRERIIILAGLVCGSLPGKALVDYVALKKHVNTDDISRVIFRDTDENHVAGDCSVKYFQKDDRELGRSYFVNDDFGFAFLNKLFVNPACNICHDIFAEYADIVFMDAWLNEYKDSKEGTSICITRSEMAASLAKEHFSNIQYVSEVDISIPIKAQTNVAVVGRKKKDNYINRYFYRLRGYDVELLKNPLPFLQVLKCAIKDIQQLIISYTAQREWAKVIGGQKTAIEFEKKLNRVIIIVKIQKMKILR